MKTSTIIGVLSIAIIACGGGSKNYRCANDGVRIENLESAFAVIVPRPAGKVDLMTIDEQEYAVVTIPELTRIKDAPLRDVADGYADQMFCSRKCAESEKARRNSEVEARIRVRMEAAVRDSLVMDSIRRGLIR